MTKLSRSDKITVTGIIIASIIGIAAIIAAWWNRHEIIAALHSWDLSISHTMQQQWHIATWQAVIWLAFLLVAWKIIVFLRKLSSRTEHPPPPFVQGIITDGVIWTVTDGEMQRPPQCSACHLDMVDTFGVGLYRENWRCPDCNRRFDWDALMQGSLNSIIESYAKRERTRINPHS